MNTKIGVYVDGQHLYHAAKVAGQKFGLANARPDYDAVITRALRESGEILGVDWREIDVATQTIYSTSKNRTLAFDRTLERFGYTVKGYILKSDTDSFDWDVRIACDVLRDVLKPRVEALDEIVDAIASDEANVGKRVEEIVRDRTISSLDLVVLITGDGDFAHLVDDLEELGVRTLVLGFPGSTSSKFAGSRWLGEGELYGD